MQRNGESKPTYIKRMRLLGLHFTGPSSAPQPEQAPQAEAAQQMAPEPLQAGIAAQVIILSRDYGLPFPMLPCAVQ